jgi:hypothetical protein
MRLCRRFQPLINDRHQLTEQLLRQVGVVEDLGRMEGAEQLPEESIAPITAETEAGAAVLDERDFELAIAHLRIPEMA